MSDRSAAGPPSGLDARRRLVLAFLTGVLVGVTVGFLIDRPLLGLVLGVVLGFTSVMRRRMADGLVRTIDAMEAEERDRRR
ncbi:MAG: hypothetical protein M0P31_15595 [Solirubrobacteraceae bacterium]|nr:hypothetical protein [Solirubrobacteraceae bacterium]